MNFAQLPQLAAGHVDCQGLEDGLQNLMRHGHLRILVACCVANPRDGAAIAAVCASQSIQNRSARFPQQVLQTILEFDWRRSSDQYLGAPARHPVVVGAGPIGLSLAIDLAQRGLAAVVLDDDFRLSTGSRAICFSRQTLEIFDRPGCGNRMVMWKSLKG